jgi:myo-inositol-1(or 4)-monophosphatase
MHPLLNIAIGAARRAGEVVVRSLDRVGGITVSEKSRNDFVTEVDRQAEQVLIAAVRKAYPAHGFLAEESGVHPGDEYTWVIDPLDGTTNFLHGFPQFAVSVACRHRGRAEVAVRARPAAR